MTDISNEEVTMTSADRSHVYVLHSASRGYSCIESYKIYGGPQQPFEYVVLNISKKRMSALAPMLMNDIRAGLNIVTIYGFSDGGAQYIVTNCKTGKDNWKITAYPESEGIRSYTTSCDISVGGVTSQTVSISGTPAEVIKAIVEPQSQATFAAFTANVRSVHTVVMAYRNSNDYFHGTMVFKSGTSMWYILSICAMRLGCNMWVSNDVLYVIDLSLKQSDLLLSSVSTYATPSLSSPISWNFAEYGTVFLNTEGAYPYNPSAEQKGILNNVIGTPDPGQEGRNLIKNNAVISIENDNIPAEGITNASSVKVLSNGTVISGKHAVYDSGQEKWSIYDALEEGDLGECKTSQSKFGVIQYDLSIPEATRDFAQHIADLIVTKYCDSEQPITFTMRETTVTVDENGDHIVTWEPTFYNNARINKIVDYSNDLVVSTASNLSPSDPSMNRPAKGMISGWVRNFPEHTTTYTFGEIAPTDMTQNNSVIHTAIKSGGM